MLTKGQKIIASIILIALIILITFNILYAKFGLSVYTRNSQFNFAQEKILKKGSYIVGKDLKQGYYDIKSLSNKESIFAGFHLSENESLHAIPFWNENKFSSNGAVQIKPADFSRLVKIKDYYEVISSGYYVIGQEIPSGKYQFLFESSKKLDIFIDIRDDKDESIKTIYWDSKYSGKTKKIYLKKGYVLNVNKEDIHQKQVEEVILRIKEVK